MPTEEQLGYQDAMRQIRRALDRRLHHLMEADNHQGDNSKKSETGIRIDEIRRVMDIIESLHR